MNEIARARELGIPFPGTPGALNAITDVAGLTLGMTTLIDGDGPLEVGKGPVRTGVTAILPRGADGLGCRILAVDHRDCPPAMHHEDAVAHPEHLQQLA